jgi:hypothetical protein
LVMPISPGRVRRVVSSVNPYVITRNGGRPTGTSWSGGLGRTRSISSRAWPPRSVRWRSTVPGPPLLQSSCFTRCRRQAPTGRHANPTLKGGSDDEAANTIRCGQEPLLCGGRTRMRNDRRSRPTAQNDSLPASTVMGGKHVGPVFRCAVSAPGGVALDCVEESARPAWGIASVGDA